MSLPVDDAKLVEFMAKPQVFLPNEATLNTVR